MSHRSSPRPSSMGRRAIKGSDEQDVHTGWRRLYVWTQRTGATAKTKRRTRRRERLEAKRQVREEVDLLPGWPERRLP